MSTGTYVTLDRTARTTRTGGDIASGKIPSQFSNYSNANEVKSEDDRPAIQPFLGACMKGKPAAASAPSLTSMVASLFGVIHLLCCLW